MYRYRVLIFSLLLAGCIRPSFGQVQGAAPEFRFRETDQTLPAGLWRLKVNGDTFTLDRASNSAFSSSISALSVGSSGTLTVLDGIVATGSIGSGHGRTDAQVEIDNALGGHGLFSCYNSYSASEECAFVASGKLSNGSVAQMSSAFTRFVNDVNTYNNYKAVLGFHLPDSTSDMNPLNLFSNNSAQLLGGATSAALWATAPAANMLAIGRTANSVSMTVNTTDFTFDKSLNGSVGGFGFGSAALAASYFYVEQPAITTAGNASYYRALFNDVNAVTIGTGTAPIVATAVFAEPNILLNGNAVTLAPTVYIAGAATEAATNAALYVASGSTMLGGAKFIVDTNGAITKLNNVAVPIASAYSFTNVTTDRTVDANASSVDELADALGTLISDLKTLGILQ